jgi:hypothetical protein
MGFPLPQLSAAAELFIINLIASGHTTLIALLKPSGYPLEDESVRRYTQWKDSSYRPDRALFRATPDSSF